MILLAWGSGRDEVWISLILVIFLLMVVLGQKLVNFIFRRFFYKKDIIDKGTVGEPDDVIK